jgi:uncharacterized membrane protein YqjE
MDLISPRRKTHPRSPTPLEAAKRLVGTVVVILNTALAIALILLAYLEADGLLLSISLLAAVILLMVAWWRPGRGARHEMDRRPLVAHRGGSSSD